jgi:ectonucleotide pyrophosphatase/phosphodiesterase family member 1/3
VFPSTATANSWTLATGLLPSSHGLVSDDSFSLFEEDGPEDGLRFFPDSLDPRFWLGEPLWLTAQKAGLRALTVSWPGGEVPLTSGACGSRCAWNSSGSALPASAAQSALARVEAVLQQLSSPRTAPSFISLSMDELAVAGRAFGPDSNQVQEALALVDKALWRLIGGLDAAGMLAESHMLLVSDHGMASSGPERALSLSQLLPADLLAAQAELLSNGAVLKGSSIMLPCPGSLSAKGGCGAAEARTLAARVNAYAATQTCGVGAAASSCSSVFRAYWKGDLPLSAAPYGGSSRVLPLVGLLSQGYTVSSGSEQGGSGWEPSGSGAMHAVAMAVGPRFAPGSRLPSPQQIFAASPEAAAAAGGAVPNTEIYGLIAELLGVEAAPHNGTAGYPAKVLLPLC